jgi:hypothetical protein
MIWLGIRGLQVMQNKKGARIAVTMVIFAIVLLSLAGCNIFSGKDGTIYGSFDFDGTSLWYLSLGGFPSGTIYDNQNYMIDPGTYDVYYTIYKSPYYYPGSTGTGDSDSTYYWHATYTVTADKGAFLFQDGKDKYFNLYLGYYGMYKYGQVKGLAGLASKSMEPEARTATWTQDGLRITVTNEIVKLSPEEAAKLGSTKIAPKP